jgi:hypothetical protein
MILEQGESYPESSFREACDRAVCNSSIGRPKFHGNPTCDKCHSTLKLNQKIERSDTASLEAYVKPSLENCRQIS